MKISELVQNVLDNAREQMFKCKDIDSLNKTYRQVRIWNRWHSIGLERPFSEDDTYKYLNDKFKEFRNEAREYIGGIDNGEVKPRQNKQKSRRVRKDIERK